MRHRSLTVALTTLTLPALSLLGGAAARADAPGSTPAATAPVVAPAPSGDRTFATMDRVGAETTIGLDMAIIGFDSDSIFDEVDITRYDLHGRYVHPSGVGVAFNLPITHLGDDDDGDDNETKIGQAELEGLYHLRRDNAHLFLRAGLVLPTADPDYDLLHALGTFARIGDFATGHGGSTWLRLGLSPEIAQGPVFARADLGVDVELARPDREDDLESAEHGPYGHFNVAAGVNAGPLQLAGELVTVMHLGDHTGEDAVSTFAVDLAFTELAVRPHVAVVVPLDDGLQETFDASVILGAEGKLPL